MTIHDFEEKLEKAGIDFSPIRTREITLLNCPAENKTEYVFRSGIHKYIYKHVIIEKTKAGKKIERRNRITAMEYTHLLKKIAPGTQTMEGEVLSFLWKDQIYQMMFLEGEDGEEDLAICILETDKTADQIVFPDFIGAVKNVSNDKAYGVRHLIHSQSTVVQ